MCGRYTLSKDHQELEGRFDFKSPGFQWVPRYNIAPTQPVMAVMGDGERSAELLRWGLIPFWAKDAGIGSKMINARAETVAEKPSFRRSLRQRRCLVPADGFYEWQRNGKMRLPMHITLKSGDAFAFAGLWESWTSPSSEVTRSCAIVTTSANSVLAPIHARMPVILAGDAEDVWLDPTADDPADLLGLLVPYPSELMEPHPVSTLVNTPDNDSPECIRPLQLRQEL